MRNFSQKLHRSSGAVVMMAVAALYLLLSAGFEESLPAQGEQGICLPPPALWPLSRVVDVVGGIALNAAVLVVIALINKGFNILRSNTRLELGLFAIMAAAVPRLVVNVNSGIFVAVAVCISIFLLFSTFDNPAGVRRVFLAFMILSLGAAMQYCFVIYLPLLWVITAQMRIFNIRSFLASVFGIMTPWIILLGFGIVGPHDFHMPEVTGIFRTFEEDSAIYFLAVTGFTSFLLIASIVLNISKTISYNARARAFNGALSLLSFVTIIAIAVNYNNLLAYLPLLNVCAACQLAHLFVNHKFERQWIAVFAVCICYIAFYIWRILL